MDSAYYLNLFQNSLNRIDQGAFHKLGLQLQVGEWYNSVVLKVQKPGWANPSATLFESGVFFSIWISDALIAQSKLSYNIHALKLRELQGYKIESRKFAQAFRERFKPFEAQWPNVHTDFGPLTLMEGSVSIDLNHFEHVIIELAWQFLSIRFIIDDLLDEQKK